MNIRIPKTSTTRRIQEIIMSVLSLALRIFTVAAIMALTYPMRPRTKLTIFFEAFVD